MHIFELRKEKLISSCNCIYLKMKDITRILKTTSSHNSYWIYIFNTESSIANGSRGRWEGGPAKSAPRIHKSWTIHLASRWYLPSFSIGISFGSPMPRVDEEKALRHLLACPRLGPCACEAQDHAHVRTRDNHTYARYKRTNKVRWSLGRWPDAGLDQTSASRAESRGRRDGTTRKGAKDREREREREKTSVYARKKRERRGNLFARCLWYVSAKNGYALMKGMGGKMYIKKK